MMVGAFIVNFEHISNFVLLFIAQFEQINAGWDSETIVLDKFVFSNCGKYILLWARKIFGINVFILILPT